VWDVGLHDGEWFAEFIQEVKKEYSNLKVGVLNVTAPREVILDRVVVSTIAVGELDICRVVR
jgi:hypothetical protein